MKPARPHLRLAPLELDQFSRNGRRPLTSAKRVMLAAASFYAEPTAQNLAILAHEAVRHGFQLEHERNQDKLREYEKERANG